MFSDLDRSIEKLFQRDFGTPLPFDLSFAIPNKDFSPLSNARNTLNCYLYDIRDDRELRNIAPILQHNTDGTVTKNYAPARIKLTYCVTAWSPAQVTPGTEPSLDEHLLLGQILQTLLRYPTLPSSVLVGALVGQQPPLPTTVALPDNSKSSGDFWSAIGGQLRPSLDYSVTISMSYQPALSGPMATTIRINNGAGEDFYTIGGTVFNTTAPSNEIAGAWVRVTETGQTYVADNSGRYIIDRIAAGNYTLTVRAVGFKEGSKTIRVPQPDGVYDVSLVPL